MRCEILLPMLLVNILLANIMVMAKQDTNQRQKPYGIFYKVYPKSPKAVTGATKAIDVQSSENDVGDEQIKLILSSQATLVNMAADATLERKKELLDMLSDNLAEKKEAIEEVKQAIVVKTAFIKTVSRIRDKTRKRLAKLKAIYKEEMDTMERMVAIARELAVEKRSLVEAAKCRAEELLSRMETALAALDRNRDMAEKANCSAAHAMKKIRTMTLEAD